MNSVTTFTLNSTSAAKNSLCSYLKCYLWSLSDGYFYFPSMSSSTFFVIFTIALIFTEITHTTTTSANPTKTIATTAATMTSFNNHNRNIFSTTNSSVLATITNIHLTSAIAVSSLSSSFSKTSNVSSILGTSCEPKVLDKIPSDPFYDFTDITVDAAKTLGNFLSKKSTTDLNELQQYANSLAYTALEKDENLLAFALAAPEAQIAVVRFQNIIESQHDVRNKTFLSNYWRELGNAWNLTDGAQLWGAPFRDCGPLRHRWLWPFSVSVLEQGHKIVASSFMAIDLDQCNDVLEEILGRKHSCDRETTFCLPTESDFSSPRGSYMCICKESYYIPNQNIQGFSGLKIENSGNKGDNFSCVPCPGRCSNCDQDGVCIYDELQEIVSMETLLRASIGTVMGACMLCCFVLSIIVFRQRKCKAIATGMWTVLETILFGVLLLYASVTLHFFQASARRCLLEHWLREIGFVVCYGSIILKLYHHLVEFRTRKAHRSVLRDTDLLKYLGVMIFAVICYMAAFTASSIDLIENTEFKGLQEVSTNTCRPLKWEYVTQISEILILCFGINLAIASRNAVTQFRERQYLVASVLIEFFASSSFYILRAIYLPELNPGAIFLALFIRSQITNTVTLGLIFLPKLWYQHKQDSHDVGHHSGGGYAGLCLGDPDVGELTISEMSPEDIRVELKRLYTQLELLKSKTLRQDNPHISKRRGGKKAANRKFSLQKKGSRDKALSSKHRSSKPHDAEVIEADPSRTPEDSVCSVEGPTDTCAELSGVSK